MRCRYGIADAKSAILSTDRIEQSAVRGKVASLGKLAGDFGVLMVVEIMAVGVEDAVSAKLKGLMDLEIKTNRRHAIVLALRSHSSERGCGVYGARLFSLTDRETARGVRVQGSGLGSGFRVQVQVRVQGSGKTKCRFLCNFLNPDTPNPEPFHDTGYKVDFLRHACRRGLRWRTLAQP